VVTAELISCNVAIPDFIEGIFGLRSAPDSARYEWLSLVVSMRNVSEVPVALIGHGVGPFGVTVQGSA
jgi:hypothetical protein